MTNVSYKKLSGKDYTNAKKELLHVIGNLRGTATSHLIEELLTEAEQIMIIKRFAAIIMFHNGHTPYRVQQAIGVSISTAQRIYEQYTQGAFEKLLRTISKKEFTRVNNLLMDIILAQASSKARARILNRVL